MAKEIERKYLVKNDDYKSLGNYVSCKQGYITRDLDKVVRVRAIGEKGYLTIKGRNHGIVREEFEYEIPVSDALVLLENYCEKFVIQKKRYEIPFQGFNWTVDEFEGENEGLVLAEIELLDEEALVDKPSWVGEEVSLDFRYAGMSLSDQPFQQWNGET